MEPGAAKIVACAAGVVAAGVGVGISAVCRNEKTNILTVRGVDFERMLRDPAYDSWFKKNLRFTQSSFFKICSMLRPLVPSVNDIYREHSFEKQVAVMLFYLGSEGGFREVAQVFGVCKGWAVTRTNQLLNALASDYKRYIYLPSTIESWLTIQEGFRERAGVPLVCGAVDGTILEITRYADYEGWYCRKGFPAVNVQAVVDNLQRFISFDIRPGSWSDKKIWNSSDFGQRVDTILPPGGFIVGDAGYTLSNFVLTPFESPRGDGELPGIYSDYNEAHSSTRMIVECTFGDMKGRFRILKRALDAKHLCNMTATIVSCMILHNVAINIRDGTDIVREKPTEMDAAEDNDDDYELFFLRYRYPSLSPQEAAHRRRERGVALRNEIAQLLQQQRF